MKINSKLIGSLLAILILSPFTNASQSVNEAGVTPDSFIWGLDNALDQLTLLLTFDKGEKAKKGLEIAKERLLEVKEMIEENKLEAAEKAKEGHGNFLNKVKQSVTALENDNSEDEIAEELEIEKELKEHEEDIEELNAEVRIKIKGVITGQEKLISLLDSLEEQAGEVKIEIKNKKDKTKIRIKQETGKSDEKINEDIEDIEEKLGLEEIKIKANIFGNKTHVKIENDFSTDAVGKDAIINEIIKRFALDKESVDRLLKIEVEDENDKDRIKAKANTKGSITEVEVELRFTLTTTDKDAIVNEIVKQSQLSKEELEKVLELKAGKNRREPEIEVEIENGVAEVEIKVGKNKQEFRLIATDKEMILQEIASRLNVSVEGIRDLVSFEIKDKGEKKRQERGRERDNQSDNRRKGSDMNGNNTGKEDEEKLEEENRNGDREKEQNAGTSSNENQQSGNEGKKSVEPPAPQQTEKVFEITARQWSFDPSVIRVKEGDKVILKITSKDVTHGFRLSAFGIDERLEPNKEMIIQFIADKKGKFAFFCSVPCGSGHGDMTGELIVE